MYYNENKKKYSLLFSRNWSWLISPEITYPQFEGTHEGYPIVVNLPTRELTRNWLLEPPEPPFTIIIAKSGQKHLYPWRIDAQSRDNFPILFEEDVYYVDRARLQHLFTVYGKLRELGFTKTEIETGDYRSDRVAKAWNEYQPLEREIEPVRKSLTLFLISYLG